CCITPITRRRIPGDAALNPALVSRSATSRARCPSIQVRGGIRRGYIRRVYSRCRLSRMSVPLTLLGLLERQPSHGYDLKRDYDNYFGRVRPLPFGQVYSTLGRLARDGKVVIGEVGPGEGPDRKPYVITDQGATEVETWLAEPVEPEPHLQTVLF